MLLLSGLRDEVVPKEHMKSLWEIVDKRQGTNAKDLGGGLPKNGEGRLPKGGVSLLHLKEIVSFVLSAVE